MIPVDDPLEAAGGDGDELPILILVQSTEALSLRGDATLIEADRAGSPFRCAGWLLGQAITRPNASMDLPDIVFNLINVGPDTLDAVSDGLRNQRRVFLTAAALHCLSFIRLAVLSPGCTQRQVRRTHTQIGGWYGRCGSVARGIPAHPQ